jgi:hypothetical protein
MDIRGRYYVELRYGYHIEAEGSEDAKEKVRKLLPSIGIFAPYNLTPTVSGEDIYSIYTPVVTEGEKKEWKRKKLNWKE